MLFSHSLCIFQQSEFPAVEDCAHCESAYYVPYSPPGGDHQHSSVRWEVCEYLSAEQEHQTKAAVLDTCLYGQGAAVFIWYLEDTAYAETYCKGKQVMYQDNQEDVLDTLQEKMMLAYWKGFLSFSASFGR